jgi:hypothetical protein
MTKEMSDKIRAQRLSMPRATLAEAQAQAKRVMAAGRKAKGCRNRRSQKRFVSRRKTSPDVVRDIMFLFGVDSVSAPKFRVAIAMVRGIWLDGYSIGWEMKKRKPALLKKLTAILCGKEKAANESNSPASGEQPRT